MNKKNHLDRPILKLNSFKNKSDEPADSIDTTSLAMNNKIVKADDNNLNEGIKPIVKNNGNVQSTKKILLAEEEYQEVLTYMQKHFPNAFPYNLAPLPLAIGIHNQIFSIPDLPFSKMKIRKFLKLYTSKRDYHKELIVDNSRFNLDGTIASKILPEETNWLIWKKVRAGRRAELKAKHDNFVKKVMESPVAASEFLEEFLPAEYRDMLDLTTLTVEKETYIEDSLKSRLSDIVYSVQTKPNDAGKTDTTLVYTLVEHVRHEGAHIKSVNSG